MFKLDHKSILIGASVVASTALFLAGCVPSSSSTNEKAPTKVRTTEKAPAKAQVNNLTGPYAGKIDSIDGGVVYPRENGMYTAYVLNEQSTKGVNHGRVPTANEIKAWDLDALPDGTGLPEGEGSVDDGDELYEAQCASCHGDFGGGGHGYPQLAGGNQSKDENGIVITLKNQREYGKTDAPKRTIGTYWPVATTLFTYIRDSMPYATPKSLSNDEVYAITAYILAQNYIKIDGETMDGDYVLDAEKLAKVVLPNRDGFYPNIDGPTGPADVKAFYADRAKNIGSGTRCMTDCKDPGGQDGKTEAEVVRIQYEMTDVSPPYSTVRDLPPVVESATVSKAERLYNDSCKVCHETDRMGGPAVGDADAWEDLMDNGFDQVLRNAIDGIGGMPPRGGNADLTDEDMKSIVDFMVNSSK